MAIKTLRQEEVKKLVAGQLVIEPCSVVRELLENSLDANACHISLNIDKHFDMIEVADDGSGIGRADRKIVGNAHATSKIRDFDDIYKKESSNYGFRGEAIHLIGTAAQEMIITSKTQQEEAGEVIVFNHGKRATCEIVAAKRGTTVKVKRLFAAYPVREKQLRKTAPEQFNKIHQLLLSYCFLYPKLRLTAQRPFFNKHPSTDLCSTIKSLFGRACLEELVPIEFVDTANDISLHGYWPKTECDITVPGVCRSRRNDRMFIYINHRCVSVDFVEKLITRVWRANATHPGCAKRFPFVVMKVSIPHNAFDVNISPDKRKLLFRDIERLKETITAALDRSIQSQSVTFTGKNQPARGPANPPKVDGIGSPTRSPTAQPNSQDGLQESLTPCYEHSLSVIHSVPDLYVGTVQTTDELSEASIGLAGGAAIGIEGRASSVKGKRSCPSDAFHERLKVARLGQSKINKHLRRSLNERSQIEDMELGEELLNKTTGAQASEGIQTTFALDNSALGAQEDSSDTPHQRDSNRVLGAGVKCSENDDGKVDDSLQQVEMMEGDTSQEDEVVEDERLDPNYIPDMSDQDGDGGEEEGETDEEDESEEGLNSEDSDDEGDESFTDDDSVRANDSKEVERSAACPDEKSCSKQKCDEAHTFVSLCHSAKVASRENPIWRSSLGGPGTRDITCTRSSQEMRGGKDLTCGPQTASKCAAREDRIPHSRSIFFDVEALRRFEPRVAAKKTVGVLVSSTVRPSISTSPSVRLPESVLNSSWSSSASCARGPSHFFLLFPPSNVSNAYFFHYRRACEYKMFHDLCTEHFVLSSSLDSAIALDADFNYLDAKEIESLMQLFKAAEDPLCFAKLSGDNRIEATVATASGAPFVTLDEAFRLNGFELRLHESLLKLYKVPKDASITLEDFIDLAHLVLQYYKSVKAGYVWHAPRSDYTAYRPARLLKIFRDQVAQSYVPIEKPDEKQVAVMTGFFERQLKLSKHCVSTGSLRAGNTGLQRAEGDVPQSIGKEMCCPHGLPILEPVLTSLPTNDP